jgi:hypothetical protein
LITAGLSYFSNTGSATIVSNLDQRKRTHFFLTKVANRVYDSAPHWWKLGDSTVVLTSGVGTMPADFAHFGTEGLVFVQGQLYSPVRYRAPDWVKFQIQNNPQPGIPVAYTLYGRTSVGLPKILCWPQDNSTLVLTSYVKRMPELIDAPLQCVGTSTITVGLPNGVYTYKTTNVTASGESEGGDISASVTSALKQITVTSIRTWWGKTVTSRKLYRTVNGGTQHKLVTTIADNTTTSYTDNIADGSLGVDIPTNATAVTGLEVFPESFHDSAIFDGLVYLLAKVKGDGREVQFDAKWETGVRRMWEEYSQGQNEVKAFPAFPGFPTGHPVWSRWRPPS